MIARMSDSAAQSLHIDLDRTDLAILHHLQADARVTNAQLAERVGLSPSPCLRRVRRLERVGLISGHATLLDQRALGLGVSAFVSVTLTDQARPELESFEANVAEWPEVMECYLMTGDFDYLLRVVVTDLDAYQRFLIDRLTRLPGVSNIQSSFALKEVIRRHALPLEHLQTRPT